MPQAYVGVVPPRTNKRGHYSMEVRFYGIDVSKGTLDIACGGRVAQIANDSKSIKAFVRSMPQGSHVAMEATNTYHIAAADVCFAAGMVVYVVNPRVTRHYRQTMGLRGHNDRMDARTIETFLRDRHRDLRQYVPQAKDQRRLRTLMRRRAKLVTTMSQLRQSMGEIKEIRKEVKVVIAKIEGLIASIESLIDKQLQGSEGRKIVSTIPGIGPVVSAVLTCDLDAGDFRRGDSFVAFYGLDPCPNDSGKRKGRRRISKQGQSLGRTMLYNAAMSASRSKAWKPIYQSYLDRGLSKVAALVALARRLALTAWSVYTHKTAFDPKRINPTLA